MASSRMEDAPALQVAEKHVGQLEQRLGAGHVHVDLVRPERRPHRDRRTVRPLVVVVEREHPGTHDAGGVEGGVALDEEAVVRRVAAEPAGEPGTARGHVVGDEVEHQGVLCREVGDVVPGAEGRVHLTVVDHCEAVVGGPGEHRQQVHVADQVAHLLVKHLGQGVQRCLAGASDRVAVRDQHRRGLTRQGPRWPEPTRTRRGQGHDAVGNVVAPARVELFEQRQDRLPEVLVAHGAATSAGSRARATTSSANGTAGPAPSRSRRVVSRPHSSSSDTRSEQERRPPNSSTARAHSSRWP